MASAAARVGFLRGRAARLELEPRDGAAPHLGQGAEGFGRDDPQLPQMVVDAMFQPYSPRDVEESEKNSLHLFGTGVAVSLQSMDLKFTAEDEAFRGEVKGWLDAN